MSMFLHEIVRSADILECVVSIQTHPHELNVFDQFDKTPLMILVNRRCKTLDIARKIVRLCVTMGADINLHRGDGKTVLYYAIEARSRYFVAAILEMSPRLNLIVDSSYTFMHKAVLCGSPDIIVLIFDHSSTAILEKRDLYNGNTFLHDLIQQRQEAVLHHVLRSDKVDYAVRICDNRGRTPLMCAALQPNPSTAIIVSLMSRCESLTYVHAVSDIKSDERDEKLLLAKQVISREITKNSQL
jgi:ankyrin repeat protein